MSTGCKKDRQTDRKTERLFSLVNKNCSECQQDVRKSVRQWDGQTEIARQSGRQKVRSIDRNRNTESQTDRQITKTEIQKVRQSDLQKSMAAK